MSKTISQIEQEQIDAMLLKANLAMSKIKNWNQQELDRLAQAIGWYSVNEKTFTKLAQMGVDESGIGDRDGRPAKRFKIHGVLRDTLRQPSTGLIERNEELGLEKYAKPAGIIASLIPMTNPALTPPVTGIYASNSGNAVIYSPHPRTKKTTFEMVEVMREACRHANAPEDLFQCISEPSIPMTKYLMEKSALTLATGGMPMVKAAYSSGKPAFGVGAGNSTIVIDKTADIAQAAKNTHQSKTSDFGSGCSADGNIVIQEEIYTEMVDALIKEGGYLCSENEKVLLEQAMWDENNNRTFSTIACKPQKITQEAGFKIPDDRTFLMVKNDGKIAFSEFCSFQYK